MKTKTWNAVNGMSSMEVVWVSQVVTIMIVVTITAITLVVCSLHESLGNDSDLSGGSGSAKR